MRFTPPYKDATPARITQGFHEEHKALDMISQMTYLGSGVPLVAPEDVLILAIVGDKYTPGDIEPRKKGWGLFMKGLESGHVHLFWHTEPIFPVSMGETVKRGKIVAYMGNSGLVYTNGVYVPITERYTKKGTHLHWEYFKSYVANKKSGFMDPQPLIDWSLSPTYTRAEQLSAAAKTLLRTYQLISK